MGGEDNPIARFVNKPTPSNAIKAKCAECVGCTATHLEEGYRGAIYACKAYACPLYLFRPYRAKKDGIRPKKGRIL